MEVRSFNGEPFVLASFPSLEHYCWQLCVCASNGMVVFIAALLIANVYDDCSTQCVADTESFEHLQLSVAFCHS